jgi:hypothetical protein
MLKNADQFLDTVAQLELASVLLTRSFEIELEAKKSGKTWDIFLIREGICIEVKNLHMDAVLLDQALTGNAEPESACALVVPAGAHTHKRPKATVQIQSPAPSPRDVIDCETVVEEDNQHV